MKLGIIIGSIREGRVTSHLAKMVEAQANKLDGVETTVIDLRDYDLPMFNEAISPKYNPNREVTGVAKSWLDTLAAQDAYVVVSPEYNRSIPGVLKNAFDYVAHEMDKKPSALVSHGSFNGGFALGHLRTIMPELGSFTIPSFIGIPYGSFDETGSYTGDADSLNQRIDGLLRSLAQHMNIR